MSLPNFCIVGLKTCLYHHCCLDCLIQCTNLACISQALGSDNMENHLRSIRKLHLAPVQGLWWQAWTKKCSITVDHGLQSEAAEQWPITLLLIQLFGNSTPALASVVHTVISSDSVIVWTWVWCSLLQLSRGKPPVSEHHRGTASLLHSDVWSHPAADQAVCIGERGIMHVWVEFALWKSTWNVWICTICVAQPCLFWGTDRGPQWGFSSGCSFEPDISVTHHYILLKAVQATVTL